MKEMARERIWNTKSGLETSVSYQPRHWLKQVMMSMVTLASGERGQVSWEEKTSPKEQMEAEKR